MKLPLLPSYFFEQYPIAQSIVTEIRAAGGTALLVGGTVRDWLLSRPIKDYDVEVYGITYEQLSSILRNYGHLGFDGKAFGVFRVRGMQIDWSLPRSDSAGRKPSVTLQPLLSFSEAFGRRDLTINALGVDLTDNTLIDPYNGYQDLKEGILRAPNQHTFIEDPLRFFRVMRFTGVLGMEPDPTLNALCHSMSLANISLERIAYEYERLLCDSDRPSLGFRWLLSISRLSELLPAIGALTSVNQRPDYHPEGTVFEHTMQALDAVAYYTRSYDHQNRMVILLSVLLHDIGKAHTTIAIDGVLRSPGHAEYGANMVPAVLATLTHKKNMTDDIVRLVKYHMHPLRLVTSDAPLPAYKTLAYELGRRVSIAMLADVARADRAGRNPASSIPFLHPDSLIERFIAYAKQAGVLYHPEEPIITGKDLMPYIAPGPNIGTYIKRSYQLQIEQGITNREALLSILLDNKHNN